MISITIPNKHVGVALSAFQDLADETYLKIMSYHGKHTSTDDRWIGTQKDRLRALIHILNTLDTTKDYTELYERAFK